MTPEGLSLKRELEPLVKKLNIKIAVISKPLSMTRGLFRIEAGVPLDRLVSSYLPKFIPELSLYPPRTIAATGIKEILICGELIYGGQKRGGIGFPQDGILLFDCRHATSNYWSRNHIHHEIFHLIDWKDDRQVYRDNEWKKLNPVGFKYGNGGILAQSDYTVGRLDPTLKGFLNRYSMSGVEEDKAEMFANMMINYRMVDLRSQTDPVIRTKMLRIKTLLYKFCPAFDNDFWTKIKEHSL